MFSKYLFAAASAVVMPAAVSAATVDLTTLHTNGDAYVSGTSVVLTDNTRWQSGTAFLRDAVDLSTLSSFSAAFSFVAGVGSPFGADGFAFMIQNSTNGIQTLGANGGGLGYGGVQNSVVVEFDTYQNFVENDGNHVGLNVNGSTRSIASQNVPFSLESGSDIFAWVDYSNEMFDIYVSDVNARPGSAILSVNFDLNDLGTEAFFGFGAGTGNESNPHVLRSFDFATTSTAVAPVPLPAGLPLALSGMALLGWVGRRKRG